MIKILNVSLGLLLLFSATGCDRAHKIEVKKEKINNLELAYYTRGKGDPLVMIMGFRGTMAAWDPRLLNELEKHFTLVLFDNRGAGLSTDSTADLTTVPQMADDTAKLIKALGYSKAHILGWSMGSRIAIELSINHPEMVQTMTLCSPNPGGKYQAVRKRNSYKDLTSLDLSDEKMLSLLYPETEKGYAARSEYVASLSKAIALGRVPDDLGMSEDTIKRQLNALKLWDENDDYYQALQTIKVPTLVTGGLDDVLDQPQNVRTVAARIPFAWSAFFPGAGHAFPSQEYENLARLIEIFIASNSQNRS